MDFQPMSPDEMQRMVQFLLNQQARFDANLARTDAVVDRLSDRVERISANLENLTEKTNRIGEAVLGLTSIVGQLAASQQRTDEQLARLGVHMDQMFERHLREDHGRPPS